MADPTCTTCGATMSRHRACPVLWLCRADDCAQRDASHMLVGDHLEPWPRCQGCGKKLGWMLSQNGRWVDWACSEQPCERKGLMSQSVPIPDEVRNRNVVLGCGLYALATGKGLGACVVSCATAEEFKDGLVHQLTSLWLTDGDAVDLFLESTQEPLTYVLFAQWESRKRGAVVSALISIQASVLACGSEARTWWPPEGDPLGGLTPISGCVRRNVDRKGVAGFLN